MPAPLTVNKAYRLTGAIPTMWDKAHPVYGHPDDLAGRYLGSLQGTRTWHAFEIRVAGAEVGVVFLTTQDLEKLEVVEL